MKRLQKRNPSTLLGMTGKVEAAWTPPSGASYVTRREGALHVDLRSSGGMASHFTGDVLSSRSWDVVADMAS